MAEVLRAVARRIAGPCMADLAVRAAVLHMQGADEAAVARELEITVTTARRAVGFGRRVVAEMQSRG